MKHKVILFVLSLCLVLSGCVEGNKKETANITSYEILLNTGSCFVYTFEDEETGVWYLSTSEGITPRLNSDGNLYNDFESPAN